MMRDSQSGFRAGRSCADQISIMRALMRRALSTDRTLYVALLDFAQAFDTFDLRYIDESLKCHKVPLKLCRLVHALYNGAKSRVKGSKGSRSRWFPLRRGVRQGDTLSPLLFLILLNSVWEKVLGTERVCGVSVGQKTIPELSYADDIALLDECLDRMQHTLHLLQEEAQNAGLQLSAPKCKLLRVTGRKPQISKTTDMDVKALLLRHRCDACDRSFDTQQGLRIHKTRWCMGREGPIHRRKGTRADKLVRRDKRKAIEENRDDKLFLKDGSEVKGTFANAYLSVQLTVEGTSDYEVECRIRKTSL